MKITNFLLGIGFLILGHFAQAQNGLENIFVERYYVSNAADAAGSVGVLPIGSVTYRIYADMLPGYKIQTIFGIPAHPLLMNTTTSFFNNEDYGANIPTFSANNAKKNTVMLDSWLTTGGACAGYNGILKPEDNGVGNFVNANGLLQNNAAQAGIPLTTQDGMLLGTVPNTGTLGLDAVIGVFGDGSANGNTFLVNDGSWYCLAGAAGPVPTTNKVLIAQITTDGIFHFELNVQIGTPAGGTENYVYSNPTGVELTIPSLIQTLLPVPALPSVSITAPSNGSTFLIGSMIDITATASDIDGTVAQVEFFVDGTSIGIDASSPYTATYTGLTAASHVLTAKATDNDGQVTVSVPVNFSISAAAPASFVVTGGGAYCQGSAGLPVGLAGSETGITYTLFKNAVAQVPTVAGTGSAVTFGNQFAGTYTVSGTNGTVTTPMSGNVIITETSSPVPTITGPAVICALASGNVYSTQAGMTNYVWSVSAGGTLASGAGTNEISVTWNAIGNETVSVSYTNSSGCTATAPAFYTVNVSTQPVAAGTITGTPIVCESSHNIVYTVPAIANASTYNWSVPAGATVVSGSNTNTITVDFAVDASSGNVIVNGANDCGSGTNSPDYAVVVNPIPSTPVISLQGYTLVSTANNGNQWYLDGIAIAGATAKEHFVVNTGNYTVVVTLDGCSSATSNTILVLEVSINDPLVVNTFEIYPNPSNGLVSIKVQSEQNKNCTIEIYNSIGSLIASKDEVISDGSFINHIDLTLAPSGSYLVVLRNSDHSVKRKVLVIK
ncbi:MAG: Ig-like domain-containing protein [Bacteroidales bacterium]